MEMTRMQVIVVLSQLKLVASLENWDEEKYEALSIAIKELERLEKENK